MEEERKFENEENKENKEENQVMWMPICMCLGVSIGMCIGGFIFDNMPIGMCMGISLGVAVGSIIDAKNRANNEQDQQTISESDEDEDN